MKNSVDYPQSREDDDSAIGSGEGGSNRTNTKRPGMRSRNVSAPGTYGKSRVASTSAVEEHNGTRWDDGSPIARAVHAAGNVARDFSVSPLARNDWIESIPLNEDGHILFFKSTNWAASALGPVETWSLGLRMHVFTVFADSRAACIYWGPEKIAIYNAHFAKLSGQVHPRLMGRSFRECFPELWADIAPRFDQAWESGIAESVSRIPLLTTRNGYPEETYFTGNFVPIRDIDGLVGGFYNSTMEVTKQVIFERRSAMLNLMNVPSGLHDGSLDTHVIPALKTNGLDITMALLYKVDEESTLGKTQLLLQSKIGVPDGHRLAAEQADLNSAAGLLPLFRQAQNEIITLPVDERFDGIEWQGCGEPSKHFSILPLSTAGRLFGFLVVGANPRRRIDFDHHDFMQNLAAKLSAIAASIVSAEETRKRAERLEKELIESEREIRYMAQNASVGMQHLSIDGNIMWANNQYYELTGHRRDQQSYALAFAEVYLEEDRPKAISAWDRLMNGEFSVSVELRLRTRTFTPPTGDPEPASILSLSNPYIEDGKVKSVMTCTTEISQLKWAESFEARKAADAREAKRQQEEIIDIISHEMRNPLSAIFQCADMIQNSLNEYKIKESTETALMDLLVSNTEHAAIILMCANHQKRIVDDVLTLSKLEYMMLSVSPRPIEPLQFVQRAVHMFATDLASHDIKLSIKAEPSLAANHIGKIMFDPSRVAQILINLLTNAIKFTRQELKREISIRFGASLSNPRNMFSRRMNWAPGNSTSNETTVDGTEWGDGEVLYFTLSVTDTGVGMTNEEINKLFHRFTQASSKTSIKYGGSGLGLFISKKLTEKQGGEIGVCSGSGAGSTFAFYVKGRRAPKGTGFPISTTISSPSPLATEPKFVERKPQDLDYMHVLLVEDNLVNQKVLSKQLRDAGCTVHIANHGMEALEFLRGSDAWHDKKVGFKRVDIILMDWEMPVMDGLACSQEIRKLQNGGEVIRHVKIIATTANAREEQIQRALESGIDAVMPKPFMTSDLLTKMRAMLSPTPQD